MSGILSLRLPLFGHIAVVHRPDLVNEHDISEVVFRVPYHQRASFERGIRESLGQEETTPRYTDGNCLERYGAMV